MRKAFPAPPDTKPARSAATVGRSASARDGFLLSPLIENTPQFARLASSGVPPGDASEVVSLLVRIDRMLEMEPDRRQLTIEFFRATSR